MTNATITLNAADALADIYDARRTKFWVIFNTDSGRVTDADGVSRLGAGEALPDAAGIVTLSGIPVPSGATNPTNFQVMVCYDAPAKASNQRDVNRERGDFGWMTVTGDANLKDLEAEQYAPPNYLVGVTGELAGYAADAEAARDAAVDISNISTPDSLVQALVKNTGGAGPLTSAALSASYAGQVAPDLFGDCPGDDTDVTSLVNAAIAAAQAFGGTLALISGKRYLCDGALVFTHTTGGNPTQEPLRMTTPGATTANGRWVANPLNGGGTLDLRYDGTDGQHPAKIDTRGAGMLEVDHINLISGGSDDFPFFQTTNTTVHLHHNFVQGNLAKSGAACKQDVFLLGGTSTTLGDGANAPFQGYGSRVHDNFFDHIRRGSIGRMYCNSVPIERNTFSTTCGNDGSGAGNLGGAIEWHGDPSAENCVGNRTHNNTIEVVNYKYAVAVEHATKNTFGPDGVWDAANGFTAAYFMGTGASFNHIVEGQASDAHPLVLGPGALDTTVDRHAQSRASLRPQPAVHIGPIVASQLDGHGPVALTTSGDQAFVGVLPGNPGGGSQPETVLYTAVAVTVTDLATTSGSTLVSSVSAAWSGEDEFMPIKAAGIPSGTRIVRRISATQVELSAQATATAQDLRPGGGDNRVTAQFGRISNSFGTAATEQIGFSRQHIITKGAVGSAVALAAADYNSAVALGTDMAFQLTVVAGSSPSAGDIAVVGAGTNWTAPPKYILVPRNANAAAVVASVHPPLKNTAANTYLTSAVPLTAGQTYVWDLIALQ